MASKKDPRLTAKICEHMTYAGKEAYKRLRTNVMIALENHSEKKSYAIGVTSAQASEGKSTTSLNLAYTLAELGKKVLLIDADMRCPSIPVCMGMSCSPGLSEVLLGKEALKNAINSYRSSTDSTKFDLIFSGENPENPSELLDSRCFRELMKTAAGIYDYVIVDLPPVNVVIDAVNVSGCTDGMIVVIRENHCSRGTLVRCMEQLSYAKANILGFVMNGCVPGSGKKYRYGKGYDYRYGS